MSSEGKMQKGSRSAGTKARGSAHAGRSARRGPSSAEETVWLNYPFMSNLIETESFDDIYRKCERTSKELDLVIRSSKDPIEIKKAQAALNAYGRALSLVRELINIKRRIIEEKAAGTRP